MTVALILPHSAINRRGVKHFQGSTSNIHRYSQRPLSRLHLYGITAPSTVMESNTFKAVPAILTDILSAICRYPSEIII